MTRDAAKWDPRFMAMATLVSGWSKDPRKQVGAVVASPDGRRFSVGYNGMPAGFEETLGGAILSKETKNRYTLHAEANAIAQAGADLTGWTIYVTDAPCLPCAMDIHRAGISRVVSSPIDRESSWASEQAEAEGFLASMGVRQDRLGA